MAKTITLKVRKAAGMPVKTFTFQKPTSLSDPKWKDLVTNVEADLNELAWQNWRIKWQDAFRRNDTEPSEYRYGGGAAPVVVRMPQNAFSPEQWEILAAEHTKAGVTLEPIEGTEWSEDETDDETSEESEA